MKGLVNQAGGLRNFFGDGSDGAFNPATILANATAPNGGTVSNLWDMNAGTVFTTGSLTSASDCVLFQIDLGSQYTIGSDTGSYIHLNAVSISTGTRVVAVEVSDDGVTWVQKGTTYSATTTPTACGVGGNTRFNTRFIRLVLKAGGSTCTFTISIGAAICSNSHTVPWNIIYPSALNGPAVVKQFSSLTLPAGYSMTVENPCQGLIIYCQGNAVINGTIDMSKKAGLAPNGNIIPMPITRKAKKTAKTSSLLHFNSNITDGNGRTWTANGSPTYDTTNKKSGTAAISLNGSSQWIDTPASDDFSFGSDDFTIDMWVRPATDATSLYVCGIADSSQTAASQVFEMQRNSANKLYFRLYDLANLSTYAVVTSVTSVVSGQFWHVAVVRSNNTLYLYINGALESSTACSFVAKRANNKLAVGRYGEYPGSYFAGQIDEFRIIKGKAMWTANFTPPTAEYTYTATYTDEPKTFEKYLQLTSVLQPLRGGYGGNGGYGGGAGAGSGRSKGGAGGGGRINQGGFGGGGGGGGAYTDQYRGGDGGSILNSDIGYGGMKFPVVHVYNNKLSARGADGVNGEGGGAGIYDTDGFINWGTTGFTNPGVVLGGGVGGLGANHTSIAERPGSEPSGGLICIISGGNISGVGVIRANGGNGTAGGPASATTASNAGGGGGGGGSGGGVIEELYAGTNTFSGTRSVNGGSAGSGGTQAGSGEAGGAGTSGGLGTIHLQQVA